MQQLFWSVTPNGMPTLAKRCPKCGHPHYTSGGQFRVNANGGLVDVWLVYRCGRCKATWNLEVLARTRPSAIGRVQYERFLANAPALALQCAFDPALLRRNHAALDVEALAFTVEGPLPTEYPCTVALQPAFPLPIPAAKALAQRLGLSGSALRRLEEAGALCCEPSLRKAKLSGPVRVAFLQDPFHPAGFRI